MNRGSWVRTPQGIGIVKRIDGQGVIWVEVAYGRVEPFQSTYVEPIVSERLVEMRAEGPPK